MELSITKNKEIIDILSISMSEISKYNNLFKKRNSYRGIVVLSDGEYCEIDVIRYADLHRHSGYSLLDGASRLEDMVNKTEYCGALTDHGVMFGIIEYYNLMKAANKKPVLGFEAYSETIDGKKESRHLILLAKNITGYKNLIKLNSQSYYNIYRKPHITYKNLKKYSEGVICLSGCIGGEIPQLLLNGEYVKAKEVANEFVSIFGKDDFYIEIQRHNFEREKCAEKLLIDFAKDLDLKIVATVDSHYTDKEDEFAQEVLLCIGTGKTITEKHMKFEGTGYYIHTSREMEEIYKDIPEALDNTLEIEEKCNVDIEFSEPKMPKFDIPAPFKDELSYFKYLCWKGFDERYRETEHYNDSVYRERLKYEIDTINKMGFPGYMLVVADFINFAKNRDIFVGPGRGSAVGSLVSYCLKITELDPIPYNLLFERFLNIERVTLPDIDSDFEDDRRDEVIEYVTNKYGKKKVSKIITFGTLAAKIVCKDVSRVLLGVGNNIGNIISKAIPDAHMSLKEALVESKELNELYIKNSDVKRVIDIAIKLEGLPRHKSQHACGIVISSEAIEGSVPTIQLENTDTGIKETTTQYPSNVLESMGLIKMDFLGLRTEGVISNTLKLINKNKIIKGERPLTLKDMDFKDVNVYRFISKGVTLGIFQLESAGMTAFMKDLFSDTDNMSDDRGLELFERLIAGISLYRPGPMDSIPTYLKNMRNPSEIEYLVPQLEPILNTTYGVLIYQEEVMQAVRDLAGYSMGRSDLVRRAMAKKKAKLMKEERNNFINGIIDKDGKIIVEGCVRRGISEEIANKIFDIMMDFTSYAFNKSHGAAYAVICYQTAYLACYYPVEFMTSILNSVISKTDKLKIYLNNLLKKNINSLPPNVNLSNNNFSIDNNSIRFGLKGIKNLGKSADNIMKEREERGIFKSYQDFVERMSKYQVMDKKMIEGLVYSGALDNFEGTRKAKLTVLQKMIDLGAKEKKDYNSGQINMFEVYSNTNSELQKLKQIDIPNLEEYNKLFKLNKEKEYAGLYISEHPLDDYYEYIKDLGLYEISAITQQSSNTDDGEGENEELDNNIVSLLDGKSVRVAGIITENNTFYTKKESNPLYTFTIEDKVGEIKSVMFYSDIKKYGHLVKKDELVVVEGTYKCDSRGIQIIAKKVYKLDDIKNYKIPKKIMVSVENTRELSKLLEYVSSNQGDTVMYINFNNKILLSNKKILMNKLIQDELDTRFKGKVKIKY